MSAVYDFSASLIKLDSLANQISKGVYELKRLNMPEPYKVQLTQLQLNLLREEMKHQLSYDMVEDGNWYIHGCKIEVIE